MTVKWTTSMTADACLSKLCEHVDTRFGAMVHSYAPIVGKIEGQSVRLQKCTMAFKNPFSKVLCGRFYSVAGGAVFEGRFRLMPLVQWALGACVLMQSAALICLVLVGVQGAPSLAGFLLWGTLGAAGIGVYKRARTLGAEEEEALVAFLKALFPESLT